MNSERIHLNKMASACQDDFDTKMIMKPLRRNFIYRINHSTAVPFDLMEAFIFGYLFFLETKPNVLKVIFRRDSVKTAWNKEIPRVFII